MKLHLRRLALPSLIACSVTVTGCSYLNTRPGHPESYNTDYLQCERVWGLSAAKAIPHCKKYAEEEEAKRKSRSLDQEAEAARFNAKRSTSAVYAIAKTPAEIAQARGYAFNLHLKYEAAAFKAADVEDTLAVPIFGLALGVAGAAIGQASPQAIAAAGLAGAGASAGWSYLHPDKDIATDQTAQAELLCVVNQSKVLNDISAVPLTLDRAALQDAMASFQEHYGGILNGTTDVKPATKAAVEKVKAAADQAMKALNDAISQYASMPGEIYQAADTINGAAETAGARMLNYNDLLSSLKAAASNQSATDEAKKTADEAKQDTKQVSDATVKQAEGKATTQEIKSTNLDAALQDTQQGAADGKAALSADADSPAAGKLGNPVEGGGQDKKTSLKNVLDDTTMSVLIRVTQLADIATNDIPSPDFAKMAANIKQCTISAK